MQDTERESQTTAGSEFLLTEITRMEFAMLQQYWHTSKKLRTTDITCRLENPIMIPYEGVESYVHLLEFFRKYPDVAQVNVRVSAREWSRPYPKNLTPWRIRGLADYADANPSKHNYLELIFGERSGGRSCIEVEFIEMGGYVIGNRMSIPGWMDGPFRFTTPTDRSKGYVQCIAPRIEDIVDRTNMVG